MDGADWAEILMAGNQVFLQDYATITGKPIASQRPNSMMGAITGSDFSHGTAGIGSGAVLVILAVVVAAVFILKD